MSPYKLIACVAMKYLIIYVNKVTKKKGKPKNKRKQTLKFSKNLDRA